MKFVVPDSTDNTELNKVLTALRGVLNAVSIDNMDALEITGVTDPIVDTNKKFLHRRGQAPSLVLCQEGEVYIPRNGIGTQDIDVRSRLSSHAFKLILIY